MLFLRFGGAWVLTSEPDLGHPKRSGSSSDMSTNPSDCIFVKSFLGTGGSSTPINSAELFLLAGC